MFAIQQDSENSVVTRDANSLRWGEASTPEPGHGEVLIKVAAAALNRADILQRQGHYPPPEGASPILGLECSGTIVEVGAGVNGSLRSTSVCALLEGGGYAEYCTAKADWTLPVDGKISAVAAAAIPEGLATCWLNLFTLAEASVGDTVLVQGASSGIGTIAIQLARAAGCRVIATASSDEKRAACLALGAEYAIDYRRNDLAHAIIDHTEGLGVDVILDNVGPRNYDLYGRILASHGRIMTIGSQGGREAAFNVGPLMQKQALIRTTSLRRTPTDQKTALFRTLKRRAWPLITAGRVLPVVDSTFGLERASDAHIRLESGEHIGKIVLTAATTTAQVLDGAHPISQAAETSLRNHWT